MKSFIQESKVISDKELNLKTVENVIKWLEENDKVTLPELEVEFRKIAKFSTTFSTPALLSLYRNAYSILGDTSFLFDDARIRSLKSHEHQHGKIIEKQHHYRQHKRKLDEKKPPQEQMEQ